MSKKKIKQKRKKLKNVVTADINCPTAPKTSEKLTNIVTNKPLNLKSETGPKPDFATANEGTPDVVSDEALPTIVSRSDGDVKEIMPTAKDAAEFAKALTPDGAQAGDTSEIVARLKRIPKVDVIVTNTEPEGLMFITPILRKMTREYGSEITLHMTKPANDSFLDLVRELDTVKEIKTHKAIDQSTVEKIEKKSGNVIMFNLLAALQQTVNRGLNATQGMAALTQIAMNQIESLQLEVALSKPARKAAETIYGKDYVVVAPEFMAGIDPTYCTPRMWDRNKWLEIANHICDDYNKEVIVLSFNNGREPVLPQGVYDNIISVVSSNAEETTAILANASLVLGIDAAFIQIARALGRPIIGLHSGGPISWSAPLYPLGDPRDGTTRVIAAIDINVVSVDDVKLCIGELIRADNKATEEVPQDTTALPEERVEDHVTGVQQGPM